MFKLVLKYSLISFQHHYNAVINTHVIVLTSLINNLGVAAGRQSGAIDNVISTCNICILLINKWI